MVRRINDYRARAGLGLLLVSRPLAAAAAWKSNDLGVNRYFSHDDGFRTWSQRIVDCGYTATSTVAENLAGGDADAASTFEMWRTSPGHNANLLDTRMKAIGIARAFVPGSPLGWYWTGTFGAAGENASTSASASPAGPALSVGASIIVTGTGPNDCLRLHAAPRISADVLACLSDRSRFAITGGPSTADGYTWWQLGGLGWSVADYLADASR